MDIDLDDNSHENNTFENDDKDSFLKLLRGNSNEAQTQDLLINKFISIYIKHNGTNSNSLQLGNYLTDTWGPQVYWTTGSQITSASATNSSGKWHCTLSVTGGMYWGDPNTRPTTTASAYKGTLTFTVRCNGSTVTITPTSGSFGYHGEGWDREQYAIGWGIESITVSGFAWDA